MLGEEELKKEHIEAKTNQINITKQEIKNINKAKTIQEQIEECEAKLKFIAKLQELLNYRDLMTSVVDEDTISREYSEKRSMMLVAYDETRFYKKMANRMKFSEDRGKGAFRSFFASLFNGKKIDREIKIKQDERIRQEITNKYIESINIKVHELKKLEISKDTLDNFMLEMDILTEKTDNNKPIFDSLREQINEAKESMDTSSDKAKDIIKNIKTNIAKVLYGAQFQDILKQLDESK
jgi:hypothetical protein